MRRESEQGERERGQEGDTREGEPHDAQALHAGLDEPERRAAERRYQRRHGLRGMPASPEHARRDKRQADRAE